MFEGGAADPVASVVGVVVLLWGTRKIFCGLDTAFSEIYETTAKNSFRDKVIDGLVVFVVVLVAVVLTWLYFSGLVLLLGAVVNAVLGGHTSGKAGGVGRGASAYETVREETMTADEFADYLTDLREGLAGRYEGMQPTADAEAADRRPVSHGDITVIEQSKPDGDEREVSLAFRWRTASDGSDDGS
mgnify:CR=1 FL=1